MIIEMIKVWSEGTEIANSNKRYDIAKTDLRLIDSFLSRNNSLISLYENTIVISVDSVHKQEALYFVAEI